MKTKESQLASYRINWEKRLFCLSQLGNTPERRKVFFETFVFLLRRIKMQIEQKTLSPRGVEDFFLNLIDNVSLAEDLSRDLQLLLWESKISDFRIALQRFIEQENTAHDPQSFSLLFQEEYSLAEKLYFAMKQYKALKEKKQTG